MSLKKVLLVSICAIVNAQATPTTTGFFAELNVGGTYNRFNMQFRPNGGEKKDQSEITKEHKNAFYVGASVGYGFELNCGFYIGAKVYGLYNNAEIKYKARDTVVANIRINDKTYKTSYLVASAKPQFSYGAAVVVGGAIVPNFLVYAQCGFEGTYWKVKGTLGGLTEAEDACFLIANGGSANQSGSVSGKTLGVDVFDSGEIKRNTFSIVPGVGAKYFFNNGMYVGLDCSVAMGLYREIERKNYNDAVATVKVDNSPVTAVNPASLGKLYTGRNVAFRYGLSLGYKF